MPKAIMNLFPQSFLTHQPRAALLVLWGCLSPVACLTPSTLSCVRITNNDALWMG